MWHHIHRHRHIVYEYQSPDTRIMKHAMNQHFGSRFEIAIQNAYDSIVSFSKHFSPFPVVKSHFFSPVIFPYKTLSIFM